MNDHFLNHLTKVGWGLNWSVFSLWLVLCFPADLMAAVYLESIDIVRHIVAQDGEKSETMDFGVIDLSKKKPKKKEEAPTFEFKPIEVKVTTVEKERMDKAIALMKKKDYENAAVNFYDIIMEPSLAQFHQMAQYHLAKSLYKMGFYNSALHFFKQIFDMGMKHRFFRMSTKWLFFLSYKMENEQLILDTISHQSEVDFPEKFRDEFYYLLAKYHYFAGELERAERLLGMISKDSKIFPKARYFLGVIHYSKGRYQEAADCFEDVILLLRERQKRGDDSMLNVLEMAYMNMARLHYEAHRYEYSIHYYSKIKKYSNNWLQSLFEESWAHFRLGNDERALGNLFTLSCPLFRDEYFPEVELLKAVIFFENCRYPETRAILDEFLNRFKPLYDKLSEILQSDWSAEDYYNLLKTIQKEKKPGEGSGRSGLYERILKLALTDRQLKKLNRAIFQIDREMELIESRSGRWSHSALAGLLSDELKMQKELLVAVAGSITKKKLKSEMESVKDLIDQALAIKYETTIAEKQMLEESIKGDVAKVRLLKYKDSVYVDEDHLYWPYDGEFWRDELGTYHYGLDRGCKP